MTDEQVVSVWKLFNKLPNKYDGMTGYTWELRLFNDGSGCILDIQDRAVVEWGDYIDAAINISGFLETLK